MFYDVRRLRGVSLALSAVVLGLAGYGLILQGTLGRMAPWFALRAQTFNVESSPGNGFKRVLGIKRDLDSGTRVGRDDRLGILIGSSTLVQGVDPSILDAEAGGGYRWTNIKVSGQAHEFALLNETMYRMGVKPEALALVVNPAILVADGDREAEAGWYDPKPLVGYLKARKIELARSELVSLTMVPWHLAFPYRGQVFTLVDRQLFLAKLRMLGALGQGVEALSAPEADPWLNDYPPGLAPGTPERNERVLKFIGIKGWYEPSSYRTDGPNFAHLRDFFRTAHEHKTRTFLVLVPESSGYRARLPGSAADHLERTLVDALGDAAPVVLDFREAAPDDDFIDVNHLSPRGREHLSHRLAGAMKSVLEPGAGGTSKP